jgi:hypothetical protein
MKKSKKWTKILTTCYCWKISRLRRSNAPHHLTWTRSSKSRKTRWMGGWGRSRRRIPRLKVKILRVNLTVSRLPQKIKRLTNSPARVSMNLPYVR